MRFALAVVLSTLVSVVASAATLEKVAIEGDAAPDPGFSYHKKFFRPAVGDGPTARVAAIVRLIPAAGRYCVVKFDTGPGPDTILACPKTTAPDGRTYLRLFDPTIAASSAATWAGRVTFDRSGVFRGDPTVVDLTADPVPGGTGLLQDYRTAIINDADDVVFAAGISGPAIVLGVAIDRGIFRCTGGDGNCSTGGTGTLETLVLINDLVPDRPGRHLCTLETYAASTYGVAFRAETQLDCANNLEPPVAGLFRFAFGGPIETVALQGEPCEPIPGPGGTTYGLVPGPPAISNTGIVAFRADTAGILRNNNLYRCDPATPCPATIAETAVRMGDLDDAGNAFQLFSAPGVSDVGDVAFQARAGDRRRVSGIYIAHVGGDIETVALVNDTAPGVTPLATFTTFNTPPTMSPGGRVAFKGTVRAVLAPRIRREALFLRQ
jgi:hypothetical protein